MKNNRITMHLTGEEKLYFEGEEVTLKELEEALKLIRNKEKSYPIVHAHWIYGTYDMICSNCRGESCYEEDYCPNCGAKMDEEVQDETINKSTM